MFKPIVKADFKRMSTSIMGHFLLEGKKPQRPQDVDEWGASYHRSLSVWGSTDGGSVCISAIPGGEDRILFP